jgi:hypothetical protein
MELPPSDRSEGASTSRLGTALPLANRLLRPSWMYSLYANDSPLAPVFEPRRRQRPHRVRHALNG